MAQAMASMAVSGSLCLGGSRHVPTHRYALLCVRAQKASEAEAAPASGRRAALGLVAAALAGGSLVQAVLADAAKPIKIGPPPPPSGGLPGTRTLNSDQARDLDLPLKERFYLQPKTPEEAIARAKESAKDIVDVKKLIEKKAWPYVQNDLRSKASYLRYDLKTIISAKPREEKKSLSELSKALFAKIDELDHAAKVKSSEAAEKSYAETVSALDSVLAKLG